MQKSFPMWFAASPVVLFCSIRLRSLKFSIYDVLATNVAIKGSSWQRNMKNSPMFAKNRPCGMEWHRLSLQR